MNTVHKYEYLLNSAKDLFISSGIKGVSIDELSRKAGISKKTFYTHFVNKNDLVLKVVQSVISELIAELASNQKKSESAIHELILQRNVYKKLTGLKPLFNKYTLRAYPDAIMAINDFKNVFFKGLLEANLEKGIGSGLYRHEINIKETAMIFVQFIGIFFYHPEYTMETVLTSNDLYLNSIVNSYGRTLVPLFDNKCPGAYISAPG
jgi:AcrR family transcriptional regulator